MFSTRPAAHYEEPGARDWRKQLRRMNWYV
jgi:hypothetical protein